MQQAFPQQCNFKTDLRAASLNRVSTGFLKASCRKPRTDPGPEQIPALLKRHPPADRDTSGSLPLFSAGGTEVRLEENLPALCCAIVLGFRGGHNVIRVAFLCLSVHSPCLQLKALVRLQRELLPFRNYRNFITFY